MTTKVHKPRRPPRAPRSLPNTAPADHPVLATDLDGTFIPLPGNTANLTDLAEIARLHQQTQLMLVYVTGRHFALALEAMELHKLPVPDWLIADVGTSIYRHTGDSRRSRRNFSDTPEYQRSLSAIVGRFGTNELHELTADLGDLELQEADRQGAYKVSYYVEVALLPKLCETLRSRLEQHDAPWAVIDSVDPETGCGLIDLLPRGVSKAHALAWWANHTATAPDRVVFAGDSRNDLAALTAGYRSIVVGNAPRSLAAEVHRAHQERGWRQCLLLATQPATSGVLEGLRWFEVTPVSGQTGGRTPDALGATPISANCTQFRVWAPACNHVNVELTDDSSTRAMPLTREPNGYHAAVVAGVSEGARYRYLLDGRTSRADPASRYQPEGVHGPSQVVVPGAFPWTDTAWRGRRWRDLVLYELHVGAFTAAGTCEAAINRLPELVELGITAVLLMPVVQSAGNWNWGYDGVGLYAVRDSYGGPSQLKAFVDACHAHGLAVLLDVVYNHVGPEGNYLPEFGPYLSTIHHTPWGDALNYDGPQATHVRRFVLANVRYWLREYHLDGLRLDAVYAMRDDSRPSILQQIQRTVQQYECSSGRTTHLIAETNVYDPNILQVNDDGATTTGLWIDCIMHSLHAQLVPDHGTCDRTYGGAIELAAALEHGYLYRVRNGGRSFPTKVDSYSAPTERPAPLESLVIALQHHDRVGNHPDGLRLHQLTCADAQRAAAALILLHPATPLLFMGEEWAVDAPFPFFADFGDPEVRRAVRAGRAREYAMPDGRHPPDPAARETFQAATCDLRAPRNSTVHAWYRRLLELRTRGLAEGWLAQQYLSVTCQPAQHLFGLHYRATGRPPITVWARLTPARAKGAPQPAATVPARGRVLLSSKPLESPPYGEHSLAPHQALITCG